MNDIAPVGTYANAGGVQYHIRPRVTSQASLRQLRRLAESRNREAATDSMKQAAESLKNKDINRAQHDMICEAAAKRMSEREDVTLDKLGDWLQDIEALVLTVVLCCEEIKLDEAWEVVPRYLEEFCMAVGKTLEAEEDSTKN